MSDLTKTVGQGTIKATVTKVPKYNLAVQEGQKVEIIRMNEPNPKGKFLVRMIDSQAGGYLRWKIENSIFFLVFICLDRCRSANSV